MVVNPCCMPLQKGVKIMAIINIVLDTINVVTMILALLAVTVWKEELKETQSDLNVAIGTLIVGIIVAILGLLLSIRLYVGARNRDIRNCKIWLIVTLILTIIDIISYVINGAAGTVYAANITFSSLALIYNIYMMWVVYAFIQELKSDNSRLGFQARLEDGAGYSMQSYPPPPAYNQNQPPVTGHATVFSAQPVVYTTGQPQPSPAGYYPQNANNQYATTGNI